MGEVCNMKFNSHYKKLKYGDLIAFEPTSKTGKLIRRIDSGGKGKFSHYGFFWCEKDGALLFLESVEGHGVRVNILQEWRQNYTIYRPADETIKPRAINEMLVLVGAKYDYKRIWALLKNRLFDIPLYADSPTSPICTEYVNFGWNYNLVKAGTATPYTLETSDTLKVL